MSSAPITTPNQDDTDEDEDEASWTDFILPVILFAIAVVPFTPLWDSFVHPEYTTRKNVRMAEFLDSVGPLPVTLVFAGLGLLLLIVAIVKSRRSAPTADENAEHEAGISS